MVRQVQGKVGRTGARTADTAAMPQLVMGFDTALLYWRAVHEGRLPYPQPLADTHLPSACVVGYRELRRLDLGPLGITLTDQGMLACYEERLVLCDGVRDGRRAFRPVPCGLGVYPGVLRPLDVLTPCRLRRRTSPLIRTHLLTHTLAPRSLYRVTPEVLVAAPELTFAQCCQRGRILPNIELALELCGTYALATGDLPCSFDRKPLVTLQGLKDYLAAARYVQGSYAAGQALAWAADLMASPRESEVYLMATLPPAWGGYGMPRPQVNASVALKGTRFAGLAQATYFEVDLIWPDKRVVLEHDGFDEHEADPAKVAADKERRSVLAALGYVVIVITKRDLRSEQSLRTKFAQVAVALGLELPHFDGKSGEAHTALFNWLFNPRHDHLPFGCGYH